MTVANEKNRNAYVATSGQTVFIYDFRILNKEHISVYQNGSLLTLTTHYTVSNVGAAGGGNVTLVTGATVNDTITIIRNVPISQLVDYVENDAFPAQTHEDAIDQLTMALQEIDEKLGRTLLLSVSSTTTGLTLPEPSALKYLRWNTAGDDLENVTISGVAKTNTTTTAPGVTNDVDEGYSVGSRWYDTTNDKEYVCLDITAGVAVWLETTVTTSGTMSNLVDDTTPQLGGDLDLNGNNIDFPTTANISDCLDEDNMASNSATALATQQSIKAYVDSTAGGDSWSDPIDSSLTLDTDSTYDFGTSTVRLATAYFDNLDLSGTFDLAHTASENDDSALDIVVDAAAFGDVKALDVVYTSGAISAGEDEAVMLVNIDETDAAGGDIAALEVIATAGSAAIFGMEVAALVQPIKQLSGVFSDADTVDVNGVDKTTELANGGAGGEAAWTADNDYVIVGDVAKFEEIEFLMATVASGAGIAPTWEYSTGVGTWSTFSPVDGTNGMNNNGAAVWLDSDVASWAVGAGSEFLIRITRTRNSLSTTPVLDEIQIVAASEFGWDQNADLTVNDITCADIAPSGTVDGRDIAADGTKLDGIEASADVTDTANVTSAGALMDSEVDADIKTLVLPANTTISAFGATVIDDANAAAARTTLGVDAAGTDNSTDVTLAGTPDYITISGQIITRNQIDLATDVTGTLPTANIADEAVTFAKMQHIATARMLGRNTAATGDVEELTAANARTVMNVDVAGTDNSTDVTLAGTPDYITISGQVITRNQIDLAADVTGVLPTANIADEAVTLAKMAHMATASFLGRTTAATGDVEVLSKAQALAILNVEDGADVTDSTNVNSAGATMNTDTSLSGNSYLLDEDDMTSNDATKVASQQSIKAYADSIQFYVGSFTRDISTATGTQAVTGVGFQPGFGHFIMAFAGNAIRSWGHSDGTTNNSSYVGGLGWNLDTSDCIHVDQGSGNVYEGDISSWDSDGFTVNWTKTGSTSGTITVFYVVCKEAS